MSNYVVILQKKKNNCATIKEVHSYVFFNQYYASKVDFFSLA